MKNSIYVIGIGPGSINTLTPQALQTALKCDILAGGKRNLKIFKDFDKEIYTLGNLEELVCFIKSNKGKKIGVIASGDPGIFSIATYLKKNLEDFKIDVIPGVSSFQYLCAKIPIEWNDMRILSLHGKEADVISELKSYSKLAIFTGGKNSPQDICKRLTASGFGHVQVWIGENLTYEDEKISNGKAQDMVEKTFSELSVMIVVDSCKNIGAAISVPGIPDSEFIRGKVPMTKEEIRAVSVSKLRLEKDSIIYDIGAGTGSVSIECALMAPHGRVYAIERNPDGVELIKSNIDKFRAWNIDIVSGQAPEALNDLPKPDRVFIGGSGGSIEGILKKLNDYFGIRVVLNAITLETLNSSVEAIKKYGFSKLEVVSLNVSKSREVGSMHLMEANNPIWIISAEKEQ